ncbi:MAG: nitroreductase [Henriciella sp.]|uniref:nitroreductase family protein n=1 Tax=Henriciella sp. TaxID=1968823 RepID=UPI0032EFF1E2
MTQNFPNAPAVGEPMVAVRPSTEVREFLSLRRSANKAAIGAPGPDADKLDEILAAATRVPDHRRLSPWRFIVFEGEARQRFGEAAAQVQKDEAPLVDDKALETTRGLLMRAPVVVAVISSPKDDNKTPVWEQELSAGALCYNLLLTANAAGWAGCWLTEWISFSDGINKVLGLEHGERVAGFLYLGTATMDPQERARSDAGSLISRWKG